MKTQPTFRLVSLLALLPALGCMSTVGSFVRTVYTDDQGRVTGVEQCDLVTYGGGDGDVGSVATGDCRVVRPGAQPRQWGPPQASSDQTTSDETWPASSEQWSDEQEAPSQPARPPAPIE